MFWTHMKHLAEQRTSNRTPACNSRFAKAGVSCFYDSEVLNSSFVYLMKYSAKNPRLRKAAKRYMHLPIYLDAMHLSFDNLAIEQLNMKRFFTDAGWERFYLGDDFSFSMYIDAVRKEYSPTSRTFEGRKPLVGIGLLEYFQQFRNA